MANDLIKRTDLAAPKQAENAASRLKSDLMRDALGRMFGEDGEKTVPGIPRVILALANHAQTAGWDRAKVLQRGMFKAAAGSGLEMKFAFYGADNAAGVRGCRITRRWITDANDMADVIESSRVQLWLLREYSRRAGAGCEGGRRPTTARGDHRRRCVP